MKKIKFSVLMSLYIKEKAEYFVECMKSILNQTAMPSEIVIVKDGPISSELENALEKYCNEFPDLIRIVSLPQNVGLGLALARGIIECSYEFIARMDTDDIAREDRFERQLELFEKKPELDICGSHIREFDGTKENIIAVRKVPLAYDDIIKYQRKRSAFNHMTVMYKKDAVLRAGNYQDALLMEDDYLWVRMIISGARGENIDDCLVDVRAGKAMIERRGGFSYFKKYQKGRRKILATGFINWSDYLVTIFIQFIVAMMPAKLRLFTFTAILR